MKRAKKIIQVIHRTFIKKYIYINVDLYLKKYVNYLKKTGIIIKGKVKYIDPSVYFDGTDYSLISLGSNITISKDVMFLTHDYSINTALCAINIYIDRHQGECHFRKKIIIGDDCFIGAKVSLLPGTTIGNNCIIGACSVVKGNIPDNSIVIGNPCKIIGNTIDYANKHNQLKDYCIEK